VGSISGLFFSEITRYREALARGTMGFFRVDNEYENNYHAENHL